MELPRRRTEEMFTCSTAGRRMREREISWSWSTRIGAKFTCEVARPTVTGLAVPVETGNVLSTDNCNCP